MIKIAISIVIINTFMTGQSFSKDNIEMGLLNTVKDPNAYSILFSGLTFSMMSFQHDSVVRKFSKENGLLPESLAVIGDYWGISGQLVLLASLNESKKSRAYVSNAFIANGLTTYFIKYFSNRKRPDNSNTFSFPSGHTSNSFLIAELANQIHGSKIGAPFFLLALNTGLSRIHHDKHFLSDVIFGAALGVAIGKGFKVLVNNENENNSLYKPKKDFRIHINWIL